MLYRILIDYNYDFLFVADIIPSPLSLFSFLDEVCCLNADIASIVFLGT